VAGFDVVVGAEGEIGGGVVEARGVGGGVGDANAWAVTSGPMPSPPMTASFNAMVIRSVAFAVNTAK